MMLSINVVILIIIFSSCLISKITCNVIWDSQIGTSSDDSAWAATADQSGHIFFGGQTMGTLYGTNNGGYDIFVSKMDGSSGNLIWGFQTGTSYYDGANSVAVDNNGDVFSVGYTYQSLYGVYLGDEDIYINKLDGSSGELIWGSQTGTSSGDNAYEVCIDSTGDVFVAGRTSGSLYAQFKGGFSDFIVSKFNGSSGDLIWGYQTGTDSMDIAYSISVDSVGNVYIAGYTDGSLDSANSGAGDIYINKLDGSSGNLIWAYQTGTINEDSASGIAVDSIGDVVVTGSTEGSLYGTSSGASDIFILKLDGLSGDFMWGYQNGTLYADYANSICVYGAEDVFIVGGTYGSMYSESNGGEDIFVSKHDSSTGNLIWGYQAGTDLPDHGVGIAVDATGNVVMAGESYGSLYGASYGGVDIIACELDGEMGGSTSTPTMDMSASPSISLSPTSPSAMPSVSPTAWAYVISPAADDIWAMGGTYTIEWIVGGEQEQQVAISLFLDAQFLFDITDQGPLNENVSTYSWNIPSTLAESDAYVVQIQMWNPIYYAHSANFTIISAKKQNSDTFSGVFTAGAIYSLSFVGFVMISMAFVKCCLYFPYIRVWKWVMWITLKCSNCGVLLLGWKLLLPAVQDCDNLMITSLAIQSVQIFCIYVVALTTWYDNFIHFLVFCLSLDAVETVIFGIASFQCGGERMIERELVFILYLVLMVGANLHIFRMLWYSREDKLFMANLLDELPTYDEEHAKLPPTVVDIHFHPPKKAKSHAPTKKETHSPDEKKNLPTSQLPSPVSTVQRPPAPDHKRPRSVQQQIALNIEAESLAHVEYISLLSVTGSYVPPMSCRDHMLADLPEIMNDVPIVLIVTECGKISSDRLKRLPVGETRLSGNEAFALAAYTYDIGFNSATGEGNDNFYVVLNRLLRERDGATVRALRPYLYFLMKGLTALPAYYGEVFRGVPCEHLDLIKETYRNFSDVHWSSFTSTTTSLSKAKGFAKGPGGIIFRINVLSGRAIRSYSALPREDEILLGPNSNFLVTSECYLDIDGFYYVTMQERNIAGVKF